MTENPGRFDREMVEHILGCPSCSRAAEMARGLDYLLALRKSAEDIEPLTVVRARVESELSKETLLRKIMSNIDYQYNSRPRLLTGIGLAVVVVFFLTLVPFSYNQVVGYRLTVRTGATDTVSPQLLTAALAAAGYENVTVTTGGDGGNLYVITNLSGSDQASRVAGAIAPLISDGNDWKIEPITAPATASLYAQAVEKATLGEEESIKLQIADDSLLINGTNISSYLWSARVTDEEVESKIRQTLAGLGITGQDIYVQSRTDWDTYMREVSFIPEADSSKAPDFELVTSDGKTVHVSGGKGSTATESSSGRRVVLKLELKEE